MLLLSSSFRGQSAFHASSGFYLLSQRNEYQPSSLIFPHLRFLFFFPSSTRTCFKFQFRDYPGFDM
ncbi:hypothetical protein BDV27DRAFT_135635 [Aspergillus caelatus]|uniref:Uncharacterized protein n=1 Tax=Aspergillus caelatus TaxID=61420 RepID=A0A5N6ZQD5_9EURO|nr:uncharacterized protein BDV27DRAFT_135635 [Aspergillus caelatus]KAE8359754.1 hypothetical protein BDV27DRAFT_135635 [Aspergillus caelatus]